jgi:hypothetical protein
MNLPKLSIRYSNGIISYVEKLSDNDSNYAKRHNIEITEIKKLEFDYNLFETLSNKINNLRSILNCLQEAVDKQNNSPSGLNYEAQFFTFYNQVKVIKERVNEIEEKLEHNYDIIEHYQLNYENHYKHLEQNDLSSSKKTLSKQL